MLYSLMVEANWTAMFISNAQLMLSLYFVILNLNVIGNTDALAKCRQAEYQVEGQCCPTCPAGMHVNRHCTEFRSTSCASCTEGTFQDGDNGREQCFLCKHCDAGLGLMVKKSCSSTSDAVCEVLDGFFCSDSNRGGCRTAQRHTVCSPGQYIGQRGTADKDTECFHCTDGTFSDGASSSCQSHRKCESVGLKLMRPGTDSTDSECREHGSERGYVAGIIPGVILVMALIAITIAINHRKKKIEKANLILDKKLDRKEEERRKVEVDRELTESTPLKSTYGPEPIRDQQEYTMNIPDGTIVDHHGDQILGPAPPSSPSQDGSVSVSVHQEDHQPVLIKTDSGASRSTPLSLGPPSPSQSPPPLSLGPPSPSQSERRFRVCSKSESSCLENPKLPRDRVSLLMDNDVAEEEVTPVLENLDPP
ncbi:tumor necrosis factor receptor superfamily member 14 isoform X2 [Gadus morhua]|uniref:tumor necrosis factor receptor superfamily member 14 isoform X2 n=1 Tax=Gadus morhua TaxID=8049 RepID=UPI0011B4A1E6|nr:tumor necrosis factor receptor superfamily member 14-like isoform X2 [Gadus morhua]